MKIKYNHLHKDSNNTGNGIKKECIYIYIYEWR